MQIAAARVDATAGGRETFSSGAELDFSRGRKRGDLTRFSQPMIRPFGFFFPYFFHRRAAVASATGELMEKGTEMPPAVQGDGAIFWSVRCRYVAATFALRRSSCRCSARSAGGSRPEEQQSENAWNYRLYLRLLRPQGPAGGGGGGGGGGEGGKSLQLP